MKWRTTRRALALAGVACAAVLCTAHEAQAITITVTTVTKLAGDTANYVQNNSTNAGEWQSTVAATKASDTAANNDVLPTVTAATRYASVLGSDSDALNFGSRNDSATSNYRVTFTVSAPIGYTYSVKIDTKFLGYLVNRDEGGAAGTETITTNVIGTLNGVGNGGLTLATAATQNPNSTTVTQISKNNSLTLTNQVGTNSYQLDFAWGQSTSSGNNVLSGGDEAVVLLGLGTGQSPTASNIGAADDYPGTSGVSDPSTLGHFVTVSATITSVPEPSTFVLAGIGLAVGGVAAWRRRRR